MSIRKNSLFEKSSLNHSNIIDEKNIDFIGCQINILMNMWNNLNLDAPYQDICEYGTKDISTLQVLPNLISILTNSAEVMTEDHPIWTEINIFKNIQAKYRRILHCDKGLQLLQRVGGCLRKMVLLNLSKIYLDLAEKFMTELHNKSTSLFLPSRQQLEYVLIRTQTAAKLICECLHYSRETFCYLIQKLQVGHLILHLMMATSVTARLNIVLKALLVQICEVYKKLYLWRKKLRKGGWEWPQPLELPEDLESWINLEESEHLKPKHLPRDQLDFLTSIFETKDNANDFSPQNEIQIVPVENTNVVLENENECIVIENDTDVDEGVFLPRFKIRNEDQELLNSMEIEEKNQMLTKPQRILLQKIKEADDMKKLKIIWDNIDTTSRDLLPRVLTPMKIRLIDKVFLQLKRRVLQLNAKSKESKIEMRFLVKVAGLKFAKHLGILPTVVGRAMQEKQADFKLKPVKTFKELKKLYEVIYQKLQSAQEYEKCEKLKKSFKSRKADIKLLAQNNERASAKKLIFSTSKLFLLEFCED